MSSHLVHCVSGLFAARKPRHRRSRRRGALRRWEVPVLESRALLSTWYVDSGFRGPSEGSRSAPFASIRAAIDVAGPGDMILVETGEGYHEADTIDVSKAKLTIGADTGASPVLDGSGAGGAGFRVEADGVTISGLTIRDFEGAAVEIASGGAATLANDGIRGNGTGVGVEAGGSATVTGSTIADNAGRGIVNHGDLSVASSTISANGGGIENDGRTATITNTTISGNQKHALVVYALEDGIGSEYDGMTAPLYTDVDEATKSGGGVENRGGTLALTGCTIAGNSAMSGGGISNSGTLTVTNCTIAHNSGDDLQGTVDQGGGHVLNYLFGGSGGGIFNGGTMTITGSTVTGNSAGSGGGIDNAGSLRITDSILAGNSAAGSGGGLCNGSVFGPPVNSTAGAAIVTGSTVTGNSAGSGGGLFNGSTSGLMVTDCSLTSNSAETDGGGLFNAGTATFTHCAFTGNSAIFGGDVFNSGTLTSTDSIVSGDGGGKIETAGDTISLIGGSTSPVNSTGGDVGHAGQPMITDGTSSGNSTGSDGDSTDHGDGRKNMRTPSIEPNLVGRHWRGRRGEGHDGGLRRRHRRDSAARDGGIANRDGTTTVTTGEHGRLSSVPSSVLRAIRSLTAWGAGHLIRPHSWAARRPGA